MMKVCLTIFFKFQMDDFIELRSPVGTANRFQHPFTMTIVGQTMSGKILPKSRVAVEEL